MSDVTASAVVCATTGVIATPFCAYLGFDIGLVLSGLVGGFVGCVISQTLLPDKAESSWRRILALTVGSVLLAIVVTLILSPWLIRTLSLADVPPGAVRFAVAAVVGACAQPLAVMGKTKFLKWFKGVGEPKETGNG